MTNSLFRTHLAAYLSGAALGGAALAMIAAPHLKLTGLEFAQSAPACAGRLSSYQVAALRERVIDAETRRDWLVHGASFYAAAKIGVTPEAVTPADLQAADHAIGDARLAFNQACG